MLGGFRREMSEQVEDYFLLLVGLSFFFGGLVSLGKKWRADFDFARLEREGLSPRMATALHAMGAAAPVTGLLFISGTSWLIEGEIGLAASLVLLMLTLVLLISLGIFLRPRWLVPPALRNKASLASTALRKGS